MKDEGGRRKAGPGSRGVKAAMIFFHPSAFILHPSSYAAIAAPPGMFVPTGYAAGPSCLRPLNQHTVNQTRLPGGTAAGR